MDETSIYRARTGPLRALLRNFVLRHLGPNDQAAFVSTGYSRVFQDFTADKSRLLAAASRVFGDSAGSPTVQNLMRIENRAKSMDPPPGGGAEKPIPPHAGNHHPGTLRPQGCSSRKPQCRSTR